MKTLRRQPMRSISRSEAAQLLRNARRAWRSDPANAGEAIGWALSVLRDSHQARRLKVDYLIHIRNFDSADALMARCMMTDSERPLIRLRFARSMFEQGRIEQAEREVERVLTLRPHHGGALRLGATIAAALGNDARASALLLEASRLDPRNLSLRADLIRALLDEGRLQEGIQILDRWTSAPNDLIARALRAQGRLLDAVEVLEAACDQLLKAAPDNSQNRVTAMLIELLDEIGAIDRLSSWTMRFAVCGLSTALAGAEALLAYGRFESCLDVLAVLSPLSHLREQVNQVRTIALALAGNVNSAQESLGQLAQPPTHSQFAERWLSGLAGRIILESQDASAIGCDPSASVLQPMLCSASATLEKALDEIRGGDSPENRDHLLNLLATCRLAMGRSDQCASALAQRTDAPQQLLVA
jgi:tetratricopeptide (TPR) repeat protein